MKAILILFEVIVGLKVNFHKSMLVELNVPNSFLNEVTSVMNYEVVMYHFFILVCQLVEMFDVFSYSIRIVFEYRLGEHICM